MTGSKGKKAKFKKHNWELEEKKKKEEIRKALDSSGAREVMEELSKPIPRTNVAEVLRAIKEKDPDERFGQIIWNAISLKGVWDAPYAKDLYLMHDEKLEKALQDYLSWLSGGPRPKKYESKRWDALFTQPKPKKDILDKIGIDPDSI